MTIAHLGLIQLRTVMLVWFLCLLPMGMWTAKAQEKSSSDLIRFLTYQSDRPEKEALGIFSCGQATADLEAAKSLAKLGGSAIPDLERELNAIEKSGQRLGDGSPWLQLAYARIKGPAAIARLHRMEGPPTLGLNRNNLDSAIALSLSLTSYVSDSRVLLRSIRCTRGPEPRDALDQLILAWERDDRGWLENSLGAKATFALKSLLNGRAWMEMRKELWPGKSAVSAVGYRFEVIGRWSEPVETLGDETSSGGVLSENPDLTTNFTNSSGGACGSVQIRFVKAPVPSAPGYLKYLIDNSDLHDLLALISHCASE